MNNVLNPNQPPLGTLFKSYELNSAVNHYLLDPFQYSITKFNYSSPEVVPGVVKGTLLYGNGKECIKFNSTDFKNDPGLVYKDVNFEKLLPAYTATKKSVNDFPAQSYHRFLANDGYFNYSEGCNNSDLWYYSADAEAKRNGVAGAALNVQEVNHIIFPEPQRGGLNSSNLAKYSWENRNNNNSESWESRSGDFPSQNNNNNCEFFNYNTHTPVPFNKVYSFDSNYCRSIGISSPSSGSMPFNK